MNQFFHQIILDSVQRNIRKKKPNLSLPQVEREVNNVSVEIVHVIRDTFFILLGSLAASFGLKSFLLPNNFIDGGVTGISLIVSELSGFSLAILLVVINAPFIILGYSTISKPFALKSVAGILILALAVHFIPYQLLTEDKLLIAVFGGFLLGLGIGLAIRGGAVIDGTEVLAIYISRKSSLTIGDVILIFNLAIFLVASYVFSLEIALYAILTYLAAAKTVDFVVSGIEEYVGVTIISPRHEEIRLAIVENMGRGCTIYSGKRGFAKRGQPLVETNIVYTLLTRLELARLQTEIDKIDPDAFLVMHSIKDAKGGMIKKRPLK